MSKLKYSVHISTNGSAAYVTDYAATSTIKEAEAKLKDLASELGAVGGIYDDEYVPGAWAEVYPYDERDNDCESYGDYPLFQIWLGPRGGVQRIAV